MDNKFKLFSPFKPTGDQPKAIKKITKGILDGEKHQVLLGATGTGKTFTMANVIQNIQKPTLILCHNKTLAAQLASEFREFFPNNAVCYFVSYYDYYQPESYMVKSDTYIEKDSSINEEIDKYRHAATMSLLTRDDVIIISSVSCIYGLGTVEDYNEMAIKLKVGTSYRRDKFLHQLTDIQYGRNDVDFRRGTFRVRGDIIEVHPTYTETAYRLEFFGDELDTISEIDTLTGEVIGTQTSTTLFPAKHTVTPKERVKGVIKFIQEELEERVRYFNEIGKHVEAQRIRQRTEYDLEMIQETGYCNGIENYSRYLSGRNPGEAPPTLLEYFPDDFLLIVDESHISIPQVGAMGGGNKSRKDNLINYGFRLPSAYDNRPLHFEEFENMIKNAVYVSATPAKYELGKTNNKFVEQIIRPTGLLDPVVEVRTCEGQIDNIFEEIKSAIARNERVLITTITKRMAEELTDFFQEAGVKVRYLHSEVDTMERIEILRDLRLGVIDVIIGINLLREGLDLPEVSFIGVLDADKQGFLRSRDALIQIIGRAARNVSGKVALYANKIDGKLVITKAMREALDETERRREIQKAHNKKHGITPKTILKAIKDLEFTRKKDKSMADDKKIPRDELRRIIINLENEMDKHSANMEFEKAAEIRDKIEDLERKIIDI